MLMLVILLACNLAGCAILFLTIYILLRPMLFGAIYFPTTPGNVAII